ncbi:MAG: FkbM family methyltransferase, partial [Cyanobacteria bacterium P01_D01_bin.71]
NESDRYTFFLRRWYDLPLQILLEKALKPGDEVVDVGAHVGLFSLAARRVVGAEGLIHAFEPNPLPCQRLQQAIALNRLENIKVYSVGLGEQTGQQSLYFSPQNSGVGSLQPPVDDAAAAEMEEILVDMQRGDEILPSAAPRLIKLDVEGAEMAAMRGCAHLIHQHLPLIIYEFIPTQAQQFNYAFRDLFALAQQHDYQIFKVELVYADGQYDLQLSPITTPDYSDSGDLLLGHIQDPFIQSMAADS